MTIAVRVLVVTVWLATFGVAACEPSSEDASKERETTKSAAREPGAPWQHENTPQNLIALFEAIRTAAEGGNLVRASALTQELVADQTRMQLALAPDTDAAFARRAAEDLKQRLPEGDGLAWFFVPNKEQTQFLAHAATTEALWMRRSKSDAAAHFDAGTVDAAKTVLRPGTTFYSVEARVPELEEQRGAHFHPFFWDGSRWTYIGRVWRFIDAPPSPNLSLEQCEAMFDHMATLMEGVDRRAGRHLGKHFGEEGIDRCLQNGLPASVYQCRLEAESLDAWSACAP